MNTPWPKSREIQKAKPLSKTDHQRILRTRARAAADRLMALKYAMREVFGSGLLAEPALEEAIELLQFIGREEPT